MIIIGEKLNSSIPSIQTAMETRNKEEILKVIKEQAENGADFLDVNTALLSNEEDAMKWIIEMIMKNTDVGIMLDSPNPKVVQACIKDIKDRKVIINSVTLVDRQEYIDIALEYNAGIVALPIDSRMPDTLEKRYENTDRLIELLTSRGIKKDSIYVDILVESLAVNPGSSDESINTLNYVKEKYSGIKTTCGLSNISFGLPKRALVNCAFLTIAVANGLDSAIMNNTSRMLMDTLHAALAVSGQDEYCLEYIQYVRNN